MVQPLEIIELATLAPNAKRFSDNNVTETWKGIVHAESGPTTAIIKILRTNQLISECVCALLGRALDLNVPRPLLIKVDKSNLPESEAWQSGLTDCIGFGSVDVSHPNFFRYLENIEANAEQINGLILDWPKLRETCFFDEWVANSDRHLRNLLYDGEGNFWLIDHSHALTGPNWKPEDLDSKAMLNNVLLDPITPHLSAHEKYQWRKQANEEIERYKEIGINGLITTSLIENFATIEQVEAVKKFIEERIQEVSRLICERLGIAELSL